MSEFIGTQYSKLINSDLRIFLPPKNLGYDTPKTVLNLVFMCFSKRCWGLRSRFFKGSIKCSFAVETYVQGYRIDGIRLGF